MIKYYPILLLSLLLFACGGGATFENGGATDSSQKGDSVSQVPDTTTSTDTVSTNEVTPATSEDSVKLFIVNEWQVQAVLAPGKDNNVMDEQQKEKMKKSSIIFKADGSQSMNVELKDEKISEEGRWRLTKGGKEVAMISPGGKERVFEIEQITRTELKLRAVLDQSGIVLRAKDAPPKGPLKK
ncbi:MAG TPA: hypothetical protein DCS93_13070 [Microscillaceae bacterium]|nr:hypothetical protein [Microscillaceae bacterium]